MGRGWESSFGLGQGLSEIIRAAGVNRIFNLKEHIHSTLEGQRRYLSVGECMQLMQWHFRMIASKERRKSAALVLFGWENADLVLGRDIKIHSDMGLSLDRTPLL